MPGLTYVDRERDGLFLGLGDFIVFSVFAAHAMRAGVAPLVSTSLGLLGGLVFTMMQVALAWPNAALKPVLPLSVGLAAVMLALERFAVHPVAETLASSGVWA